MRCVWWRHSRLTATRLRCLVQTPSRRPLQRTGRWCHKFLPIRNSSHSSSTSGKDGRGKSKECEQGATSTAGALQTSVAGGRAEQRRLQAAQKRLQLQHEHLQQQLENEQVKLDTSTTPGATSQEDAEEGEKLLASQLRWLLQYSQQMDRVSGFFEPQLLHVYWRLFLLQRQLQGANYAHDAKLADSKQCSDRDVLSAAVGEIGVFHGKSFLPLWALRSKGEAAVAIDLFEGQQEKNQDASGLGSRKSFEKALRRFSDLEHLGEKLQPPIIIEADSTTLSSEDLLRATGGKRFRIMSVDGSHTAQATRSDLALASSVLVGGNMYCGASETDNGVHSMPSLGVVILDDALNADWPGVATGLATFLLMDESNTKCACRFCSARRQEGGGGKTSEQDNDSNMDGCTALAPFLLAYNKCFLCRPAAHHLYLDAMLNNDEDGSVDNASNGTARKKAEFMGWPVAIYPQGWIAAFHGNDRTASM